MVNYLPFGYKKHLVFSKLLEWHYTDVDKWILCIVEEWNPLLFLFLQRNFKTLGKLYSKFRCLWSNSCPLGMGYKNYLVFNKFVGMALYWCWQINPLLFLFLQRKFKIIGELYSKFGCLWWTACPLGMRYKQKHNVLDKLVVTNRI